MPKYSAAQVVAAREAQSTYRSEVRAAWAAECEAAKARVRAVEEAERVRDERLRSIGVNVNDMRDIG
jgi:hypothetical protein